MGKKFLPWCDAKFDGARTVGKEETPKISADEGRDKNSKI